MKKELDKYRVRCERLEREKDDLSGKKNRNVGVNGGTGSEVMRFQQRIRELETNNEDLIDGNKNKAKNKGNKNNRCSVAQISDLRNCALPNLNAN